MLLLFNISEQVESYLPTTSTPNNNLVRAGGLCLCSRDFNRQVESNLEHQMIIQVRAGGLCLCSRDFNRQVKPYLPTT